jgi:hypothetical protein
MLAERAAQIPYPGGDALFVDEPSHRSRPLEEIAITAYYCGKPARGMQAADTLLAQRGHSSSFYDSIARNQTFYLRNIVVNRSGRFPMPTGLDAKYGMPYAGTNPTLVSHGAGYVAHVRLVNYKQTNGRHYEADGGVFRTRGAVMGWSPNDGPLTECREVDCALPDGWSETRINGLEDVRWVRHQDRVWFTATCCQVPSAGGWPRVVLGLMTPDLCGVERVMRLDYGKQGEGDREKNWVPWSRGDDLLLIYSYDPFVVLRVDTETGACAEVQRWTPPFNASRWKGSTAPVPWEDGHWLMLVHETAYMLGSDSQWAYSVYAHRFVELEDDTLTVTRYSRPFTWERQGTAGACIEYAAGLVRHDAGLIVTYGVEDREAAWAEIAPETVEMMLGR